MGIIGLGYWGPNLVRNFNFLSKCSLTHLCDLDEERLQRMKGSYPSAVVTKDAKEILENPTLDVVVIATSPGSHYELVKSAITNGKHAFVCKPLTTDLDEAKELVELAEKSKRILHVDHTFVYTPSIRQIKKIFVMGEFGRLDHIDSVRISAPYRMDTNIVWDLAPHDVSILQYLLGRKPSAVIAQSNGKSVGPSEHLAYVSLFFDDSLIANFHLNWLSPIKMRRMIFGGTTNMVVFDDMEMVEKIKVYDRGIEFVPTPDDPFKGDVQLRLGNITSPFVENREALAIECEEFIDAVLNEGTTSTSGQNCYDVMAVCEAINNSLLQGGKLIELDD